MNSPTPPISPWARFDAQGAPFFARDFCPPALAKGGLVGLGGFFWSGRISRGRAVAASLAGVRVLKFVAMGRPRPGSAPADGFRQALFWRRHRPRPCEAKRTFAKEPTTPPPFLPGAEPGGGNGLGQKKPPKPTKPPFLPGRLRCKGISLSKATEILNRSKSPHPPPSPQPARSRPGFPAPPKLQTVRRLVQQRHQAQREPQCQGEDAHLHGGPA